MPVVLYLTGFDVNCSSPVPLQRGLQIEATKHKSTAAGCTATQSMHVSTADATYKHCCIRLGLYLRANKQVKLLVAVFSLLWQAVQTTITVCSNLQAYLTYNHWAFCQPRMPYMELTTVTVSTCCKIHATQVATEQTSTVLGETWLSARLLRYLQ